MAGRVVIPATVTRPRKGTPPSLRRTEPGGLTTESVHHAFGELLALEDVSFPVRRGEVVGLVGRNGAGKTTLMRAIMGILAPDAGRITWEGGPITRSDLRSFGYMPEERGLYPQMRLLDQLVYLGRLHGLDGARALSRAQAWVGRLGLAGREADKLIALSHGNQQRAQLAAALVHEPPLMVLDEPFAGLDPEAADVLTSVVRERAREGAAVLFSSHQLDLVERACDRVVIIDAGRVRADGTIRELRARLPRRLRVHVAGGRWAPALPGVTVTAARPDGVLVEIAEGVDLPALLRDAQAAGPVDHFALEEADLDELFRALVRS